MLSIFSFRFFCASLSLSFLILLSPQAHGFYASDHESVENYSQFSQELLEQSHSELIDPFTGKMTLVYQDFVSKGNGGFDLVFTRHNTSAPFVDWEWAGGYNDKLCEDSDSSYTDNNPSIRLANARKEIFYSVEKRVWVTHSGWRAECPDGISIYVYSPAGRRYEFNTHGVKKITDSNGNYAEYNYETKSGSYYEHEGGGDGRWRYYNYTVLNSLSTNDGREIKFSYGGGSPSRESSGKLSSISSGAKKTQYVYKNVDWRTYAGADDWDYHSANVLDSVVYSEDKKWQYDYHTGYHPSSFKNLMIQAVTHPSGGQVTYEYGVNNGRNHQYPCKGVYLVSKKTNTGGLWRYDYSRCNDNPHDDHTVVTTPEGTIRYDFFGPLNIGADKLWKIGRLAKKEIKASFI